MPMDEYDEGHKTKFNKIYNVYKDDDLEDIANIYDKEELGENFAEISQSCEYAHFKTIVINLRNSFKVFDGRNITCIGARIAVVSKREDYEKFYKLHGYSMPTQWNLVNVWKGYRPDADSPI